MNLNEYLTNPNVLAFFQVIRTGEGTLGEDGYRTHYGGTLFEDFTDHPRKVIKAGKWASSAAGAYQFLTKTWDGLVRQYGFTDFSPVNQDLGALALIKGRSALKDVLDGDIESAIRKCAKEWASLPGSPYGQPTISLAKALKIYLEAGGTLKKKDTIMLPILQAVLPTLVTAVPELIRIFGASPRAEMNAKAAELVVATAMQATGSVNEQMLVEKIQSGDQDAINQVKAAVKEIWYEISLDTGGIEQARDVNFKSEGFYKQPAFWITLTLLPLVYLVVLSVLGFVGSVLFSIEIQIMVVSSIISGLLGAISGFWLGTSWSSARKTEIANK